MNSSHWKIKLRCARRQQRVCLMAGLAERKSRIVFCCFLGRCLQGKQSGSKTTKDQSFTELFCTRREAEGYAASFMAEHLTTDTPVAILPSTLCEERRRVLRRKQKSAGRGFAATIKDVRCFPFTTPNGQAGRRAGIHLQNCNGAFNCAIACGGAKILFLPNCMRRFQCRAGRDTT